MAQHDYVIANGTGAAVRSDLNNALAAIVSQNSGATEPTTTYAYMPWADTGSSPPVFKIRNAANNGWITLYQLDGEWSTIALENGTAGAPSLYFKDSGTDTGFYSPGADQVAVTTAGVQQLLVDSYGVNTSGGGVFRGGVSSYAVNGGIIQFSSPYTDIRACRSGGNYAGMRFFTQGANSSGAQAERMSITTEGLVGIGSTPARTLHVFGETALSNSANTGTFLFLPAASANYLYSRAADGSSTAVPFVLSMGSTEALRVDASSRLLVGTSSATANGGVLELSSGITFPATAVAASNANTLDDYEEGDWTPTLTGTTGSIGSQAYTVQAGTYIKIGQLVVLTGFLALSDKGSWTGGVQIGGLPFAVGNNNKYYSANTFYNTNLTLAANNFGAGAYLVIGTLTARMFSHNNTGSSTLDYGTNIANNSQIGAFEFVYFTT